MNIKTFSNSIELSVYTIRYYEKIGLFHNIQRNASGSLVQYGMSLNVEGVSNME